MRTWIIDTKRDKESGRIMVVKVPNPNRRPLVNLPFTLYRVTRAGAPMWVTNKLDAIRLADAHQAVLKLEGRHVHKVTLTNADDVLKYLNGNVQEASSERIYTA